MQKKFLSVLLGIFATTFVACNGGGGGSATGEAAGAAPVAVTIPPPTVSGATVKAGDESPLVPSPDGNGFVRLNSMDESARATVTLSGQSD